jgi:hypothetical protein
MTVTIGRRELLVALGGAAVAWPLAARAQQPALRVVAILNEQETPEAFAVRLMAFQRGLAEGGYDDGRNLTIETYMLIVVTVAVAMLLDLRVSQATQMPWCAGSFRGRYVWSGTTISGNRRPRIDNLPKRPKMPSLAPPTLKARCDNRQSFLARADEVIE